MNKYLLCCFGALGAYMLYLYTYTYTHTWPHGPGFQNQGLGLPVNDLGSPGHGFGSTQHGLATLWEPGDGRPVSHPIWSAEPVPRAARRAEPSS